MYVSLVLKFVTWGSVHAGNEKISNAARVTASKNKKHF